MSSTQIMPPTPPPSPGGSRFRQPAVWLAAGAFLLALTALIVAVAGGGGAEPKATAGATTAEPRASATEAAPSALPTRSATGKAQASQATSGSVPDSPVTCPAASVKVSDAATLEQALAQAQPGDSISLANGTYVGNFAAEISGTAAKPVFLCGGSGAVIDGGGTDDGYAFHLNQRQLLAARRLHRPQRTEGRDGGRRGGHRHPGPHRRTDR